MSWFLMRMHPCDTAPGSSSGRLVPWMPMNPPAGQSLRSDWALVPKASGPYHALA